MVRQQAHHLRAVLQRGKLAVNNRLYAGAQGIMQQDPTTTGEVLLWFVSLVTPLAGRGSLERSPNVMLAGLEGNAEITEKWWLKGAVSVQRAPWRWTVREPQKTYERRQAAYDRLQVKQKRAGARLSNYRLVTFILGAASSIYLYRTVNEAVGLTVGALALAVFVYLALRHAQLDSRLKHAELLTELNRKGIGRLTGTWIESPDQGAEFRDEAHPFASDLDLFGRASVFQWISSAQTPLGRETLARLLKQPLKDRAEIILRQDAVAEMADGLAWRQRFEAEGILSAAEQNPTEPLLQWAKERQPAYQRPIVRLGLRVLPVLTLVMVVLCLSGGFVPGQVPALLAAAQFLLLWLGGKKRSRVLATVHRYEASLRTYAQMLRLVEGQSFRSQWLRKRQASLRDGAGRSAGEQIQRLAKVVEGISNRQNALFFAINVLTLWDYQCMIALEDWKAQSGRLLATWLSVIAEIESLCSLANIRFDHPGWAMPNIADDRNELHQSPSGLSARKLGHPLITKDRVVNDLEMRAPAQIFVITGSNMSGKSTFLRTVGINLVLAAIGAPACAEQFHCLPMDLWTCMRISDNLEQSISSFYAEILRIKQIVEAARVDRPICFLLDEIFKGTNSYDRHQGAKALINQLRRDGAFGLVSTHDLELGDLESESNGRIKNYHFRESYANNQIHFDYRLRRGISTTRNALYLIKMAGIELDEGTN